MPPNDVGDAPVTSYEITSIPSGGSTTTAGTEATGTVAGLTPGRSYQFIVTARNTAGIGPPSAASNPLIISDTVNEGYVLPPEIVSRAPDGTRLNDSHFTDWPTDVLTSDGSELGFFAGDARLGPNGYGQGVVRNLETGSIDVVTQSAAYLEPPPDAPPGFAPPFGAVQALSRNGRFVAFCGAPYWYYPDDLVHCHLLDRETGNLDLIDRDSLGNPGSGTGAEANQAVQSISDDGRYVLFNSQSSRLLPPGAPEGFHPYRLDRQTGLVDIVGRTLNGDVAAGSQGLQMTPDGRYITFVSPDGNVVPGDGNGKTDVFRRDMVTNETDLISTGLDRAVDPGIFGVAGEMSADGTKVPFQTSGDGSQTAVQVYLRDTDQGTTTLVSISEQGTPLPGFSLYSSISDDGKRIAFCWSEFSPRCSDGQVYVRDLEASWSERAFTSATNTQSFDANRPHISGDGPEFVNLNEAPVRGYYRAVASVCSGGLIQELVGILGGSGGLLTNRSGCAL